MHNRRFYVHALYSRPEKRSCRADSFVYWIHQTTPNDLCARTVWHVYTYTMYAFARGKKSQNLNVPEFTTFTRITDQRIYMLCVYTRHTKEFRNSPRFGKWFSARFTADTRRDIYNMYIHTYIVYADTPLRLPDLPYSVIRRDFLSMFDQFLTLYNAQIWIRFFVQFKTNSVDDTTSFFTTKAIFYLRDF